MNNKTYYGEYSLRHWITMILKKELILPEYQRTFIWKKENITKLINSLNNDFFVPPVTIGHYETEDIKENLIIDGQQRLSSILLAYLDICPKKDAFKAEKSDIEQFANENDDTSDEDEIILGWTFKKLLKYGKSKDEILNNLKKDAKEFSKYEHLDLTNRNIQIDDFFLDNHFLGFSFLIPKDDNVVYFSSVFRDINAEGIKLTQLETRQSLYFLAPGFEEFFDPKCIRKILVKKEDKTERIDFVRYLACLFQYEKNDSSVSNLCKNYARKFEEYYNLFIQSIITNQEDSIFLKFDEKYKNNIVKLPEYIHALSLIQNSFISIIDADIYLFGLFYFILIKNKQINLSKALELNKDLKQKIKELKENTVDGFLHKKTPSALKYLKIRINESIEIYRNYLKND